MWTANFEDGTSVSSKNIYWTDIDKTKKITGVFLIHPAYPNLKLCLTGLDEYFYMQEGLALFGLSGQLQSNRAVAEIIGGVKDGVVVEQRLEYSGVVITKSYPVAKCKVSKEVMYPGK